MNHSKTISLTCHHIKEQAILFGEQLRNLNVCAKEYVPPIHCDNGNWARSSQENTDTFAQHLIQVFQLILSNGNDDTDAKINDFLEAPMQMSLPPKKFSVVEVQ